MLERRSLTSGSTWHAAGNVTYFGHYAGLTRLYVNSIRTYLEAEAESGQAVSFHAAGSLRLATTPEELEAYKRLEPLYETLQVPYAVIGPDAIKDIHPLLDTDGLHGAAHTPTDGHVDASGATHALAKAARTRGAQIRQQSPVAGLCHDNGAWRVTLASGEALDAENVILATSFWARELAEQVGLKLPLYPLEHHEIVTESLPALAALGFEVPTVRDPAAPANTRQEGHGFLCGVYEATPKFWAVEGIPEDFAEELLPPDLERLEPHLERVLARLPCFGEAGIKAINNGPICYTPDGAPLLGPAPGQPGLWLATGFCVGIGTGGGSGEYLARWMVEGRTPYDLPLVSPARFAEDLSRSDCLEMIWRTYTAGYPLPKISGPEMPSREVAPAPESSEVGTTRVGVSAV